MLLPPGPLCKTSDVLQMFSEGVYITTTEFGPHFCFPLTKCSSFEAMLIHSPSWEGDGWGRSGLLRLLYQCGRTPKTHTQLLWDDFELCM